jgi:hypothetical protein
MRKRRPAPVGIAEELEVDEIERATHARRVRALGVDAGGEEQGVGAARIELESAAQPAEQALVIPPQVEALDVERDKASQRLALAEARQPQRMHAWRGRQLGAARARRTGAALPCDLGREHDPEGEPQPPRHRRKRALLPPQKFSRWKSNRPAAASSPA